MIDSLRSGHEELERKLAERYLFAKLIREVRVLRKLTKDVLPTGATACNICFRDFPHSEETHRHDQHYLDQISEDWFDAGGFRK
jgi:hypothetical protein